MICGILMFGLETDIDLVLMIFKARRVDGRTLKSIDKIKCQKH